MLVSQVVTVGTTSGVSNQPVTKLYYPTRVAEVARTWLDPHTHRITHGS